MEDVETQKQKLYSILKLKDRDMMEDDISKDWGDIFEIQRMITEISRFAISDLGTERNNDDQYVPLSPDGDNENEIFGNKSFHTSSFRNWVKNKSIAILTTYGYPIEIIDRGLNIVLGIGEKERKGLPNKIKGDNFMPSIYELGELMHISNGNTKPTLTRLVELNPENNEDSVFMIVSSLPTHELRMIDSTIILQGCMRFTKSKILTDILPIQGVDTYSQPPLLLKEVLEEPDQEKQKEIAEKILMSNSEPSYLKDIFHPDDEEVFEYVRDRENFKELKQNIKQMKLEHLEVIRNKGVVRITQQYESNRYYIVKKKEGGRSRNTYDEALFYRIPPTYWRYICRIFHIRPKLEFKINGDRVIIRVHEKLPSRGQRVMASTQSLGKWVRRSRDFKLIDKYEKDSSSRLEWNIHRNLWTNFVKGYLQKYCLYEMEEIK